ncbi:hypothetical protein HK100_003098 [Physocladia obscura]|uniref:Uncharacterized protein n=1 Tax=Physocladia obscura TaxID=109957 RepID=A0AAD5SUE8_9FUNG|nr:hypothetical protein HK100_003098 [Physocladia obscura]
MANNWVTVACHGAKKLVKPLALMPKECPTQTHQQWNQTVHQTRQRDAIRMSKELSDLKTFVIVCVELHSNWQLQACQPKERKHLINAYVTQMLYCPIGDVPLVVQILQECRQQVLSGEFNPLAIRLDGQLLGETAKQQAAKHLVYLCRNAPTRSLCDTVLNGALEMSGSSCPSSLQFARSSSKSLVIGSKPGHQLKAGPSAKAGIS